MPSLANVTVFCFLASYLVAFGLECARLGGRWGRWGRRLALSRMFPLLAGTAGLVAHTAYLIVRSGQTNLPPLLSSAHDWLLVLAWVAILFYLLLTVLDRKLPIGLFLLPLVLGLVAAAYLVSSEPNAVIGSDPEMQRAAGRAWWMLHASLLVFGMAGVLVGLVVGMMYLVQHRRLKQKQAGRAELSLPSLERLARLNWWAVILSVPLLALGMAVGIGLVLVQEGETGVRLTDFVVLINGGLVVLAMVFFVWLLWAEHPIGRQVAWLTVWAFGFLLVMLVGLLVLTGGEWGPVDSWHASYHSPHAPRGEFATRSVASTMTGEAAGR